jgi:hypothetical protein
MSAAADTLRGMPHAATERRLLRVLVLVVGVSALGAEIPGARLPIASDSEPSTDRVREAVAAAHPINTYAAEEEAAA